MYISVYVCIYVYIYIHTYTYGLLVPDVIGTHTHMGFWYRMLSAHIHIWAFGTGCYRHTYTYGLSVPDVIGNGAMEKHGLLRNPQKSVPYYI